MATVQEYFAGWNHPWPALAGVARSVGVPAGTTKEILAEIGGEQIDVTGYESRKVFETDSVSTLFALAVVRGQRITLRAVGPLAP